MKKDERIAEQKQLDALGPYYGKMILVEGGTFQMGSNDGEVREKPVHSVTLSSYYIGETPVTQAQWKAVMGSNPSHFKGDDSCPIEMVSWDDIKVFIKKLNAKVAKRYRLPTEAEWEFAARGGINSKGYTYSGSDDIDEVAWVGENADCKTRPVKNKKPNELGLYDMSGNVWEWCADWYGAYSNGADTNPQGPESGSNRVYRGGAWFNDPHRCRPSCRNNTRPAAQYSYLGFRLALTPP